MGFEQQAHTLASLTLLFGIPRIHNNVIQFVCCFYILSLDLTIDAILLLASCDWISESKLLNCLLVILSSFSVLTLFQDTNFHLHFLVVASITIYSRLFSTIINICYKINNNKDSFGFTWLCITLSYSYYLSCMLKVKL